MSRRNYHGRAYAKAQNVRPTYIKAYDAALAKVDVLVTPTCITTAPRNYTPDNYLEAVETNLATINSSGSRNTLPFNYTGHPALALPVGKSSAGLPVSMQLVGRFFDDPILMRAAYAYQQSTDWDNNIGVATDRARVDSRFICHSKQGQQTNGYPDSPKGLQVSDRTGGSSVH
jgi:amidase